MKYLSYNELPLSMTRAEFETTDFFEMTFKYLHRLNKAQPNRRLRALTYNIRFEDGTKEKLEVYITDSIYNVKSYMVEDETN